MRWARLICFAGGGWQVKVVLDSGQEAELASAMTPYSREI